MSTNEKVEDILSDRNYMYSVKILRYMFSILGLWPFTSRFYSTTLRVILIVMFSFLQLFITIPAFLFCFYIIETLKDRMKLMGSAFFIFVNFLKYMLLVINNKEFAEHLTHMAMDWRENTNEETIRKIMVEKSQTAKFFMILSASVMISSGTFFCTVATLTAKPYMVVGNETFFHLPLDAHFIYFTVYQKKLFPFVYIAQCMGTGSVYVLTSGICNINIQGILHISSQCSIITSMIRELNKDFNNDLVGTIIKYQSRSLRHVSNMQEMMSKIYLLEFLSSTFLICFVGYYLILDMKNNNVVSFFAYCMFLVAFTYSIYVFCYLGEHLTEQYESVGEEAFSLEWYNLTVSQVRSLHLIILFAQRPVYMSAGKIVNFSIPSFTNVMKGAATYLNMFRTLTQT